ncbi:hypothetical protein TNCV_1215121 [Trichonephila clavipes]|nr:hypothetical protein TNCV_1215121 [Trichonephila clavipes]
MGQCVQMWTRNYGALDQTAWCVLACYAPIGRRRRSRETLVLRIRRSEGRVVNTPLVFKKGCFGGHEKGDEKRTEKDPEREKRPERERRRK